MRYLTVLLSLVFLYSVLGYAQESTTGEPGIGLPANGKPVDAALSPNAWVPNKISYQGLLTTTGGAPVADGAYELKFELFNVSGGGGALWSETQSGVNVYKGTFSVLLGSVTPLIGIFYQPLWIEVTANSGPGIAAPILFTPRTELASAAYSLGPWYSDSGKIWVTDQKYVGINTTVPAFPLDVDFTLPTVAKFGHNDPLYIIRWNPIIGFNIYFSGGFKYGSSNEGGGTLSYDQEVNNGFSFNIAPNGVADQPAALIPRLVIRDTGRVGIGTINPDKLLHVAGSVHVQDTLFLGSATQSGILNIYQNGTDLPTAYIGPFLNYGAELQLKEEGGIPYFWAEPDIDGTGGFFQINRTTSISGFVVNGNYNGTQQPYVSINGATRSAIFNMSQTADNSVDLPDSSISSVEILDEPGVSNSERPSYFASIPTVGTTVVADSVDITVPMAGYIEITGGAWLNINHVTGTLTEAWLGINGTRASLPIYPGLGVVRLPGTAPTGTGASAYGYPTMVRRFYAVPSGTHRYYLNFYWQQGAAASISAGSPYIAAKYFPTLYGTSTVMDPNAVSAVSGPTDGSEVINIPQITITPEEHLNQLKAKAAQLKNEIEQTIRQLDKNADGPQSGGK